MTKLSLIVPCYNCENTLEEAVESIFSQAPVFPFDVTMVDDGSTDSTYDVMQNLARRHRDIRLLRHERNLGGGAARNSAVAATDGNLIFCLDSDDVLGPRFLENMTRFWNERKCDGVGMSTSIKFRGPDTRNVEYVSNFGPTGKAVRFESFLEGEPCPLHVVFMMTRAAFRRVGGYPTHHGFDTQGMGFRFLCNGLEARVCPDTIYFHRVGLSRSYYKREQATDRLNWNWFNVLDEFLYLFKDQVKEMLLEHNLFDVPGKPAPGDLARIVQGRSDIYSPHHASLIKRGPEGVARDSARSQDRYMQYWLGNFHRTKGRYKRALTHYSRALELGFGFRIVHFRMLQAQLGLAGSSKSPVDALEELLLYSRPFPAERRPLRERILHGLLERETLRQPVLAAKSLRDRLRSGKLG